MPPAVLRLTNVRQDGAVEVHPVAGGRVADLVHVQHNGLDTGGNLGLIHALGTQHLALDGAVPVVLENAVPGDLHCSDANAARQDEAPDGRINQEDKCRFSGRRT